MLNFMDGSGGKIVGKLCKQTIVSEFDSLWVLYISGIISYYANLSKEGSLFGVLAKVQDCGLEISVFELQSYIHFRVNTLGKGMNPH